MTNLDDYEHQLEIRRKDGSTYKIYITALGSGYTYIIYRDGAHIVSNPNIHTSTDQAFQSAFEWVKGQK